MQIKFAKDCAWRAVYVYSGTSSQPGPLRFSIGLDPTFRHNQAQLFGSIGFRRDCSGGFKSGWHWSFFLPKSRHWWKLDGRRSS